MYGWILLSAYVLYGIQPICVKGTSPIAILTFDKLFRQQQERTPGRGMQNQEMAPGAMPEGTPQGFYQRQSDQQSTRNIHNATISGPSTGTSTEEKKRVRLIVRLKIDWRKLTIW